jgi:hypothetical protein
MFDNFYSINYSSLPYWVNETEFKKDLYGKFISAILDARDQELLEIPGGELLCPFVSNNKAETKTIATGLVRDIHYPQPWFDLVRNGQKTVDGRVGPPGDYMPGELLNVAIAEAETGAGVQRLIVNNVVHYNNLEEYLQDCWKEATPHAHDIQDACQIHLNIRCIRNDHFEQIFEHKRIEQRGGINALFFNILDINE